MDKDRKFLSYILKDIKDAESFIAGFDFEKFSKSSLVQNAVFKSLENIGEGANNLSKEIKAKNSEIPWAKVIGNRNFLTHEYFGVKLATVWNTIKKDLPPLKKAIEDLIKLSK